MSKNFPRFYFLLFGILDLAALLTALFYSLDVLDQYFSYFTILSNILVTFVFLSFGLLGMKRVLSYRFMQALYGPAVLYMSITGVVFWTLLHGGAGHIQLLPWVNMVLHGITPIVAFMGWILFPRKTHLSYDDAYKWVLFPLAFLFYTLVRGPIVHWYPYVILNPATAGGYVGVAKYSLSILAGAYVGALLLILINNKLRSK